MRYRSAHHAGGPGDLIQARVRVAAELLLRGTDLGSLLWLIVGCGSVVTVVLSLLIATVPVPRRLLDEDDYLALGIPLAHVPQRIRHLTERIAAVDDGRDLSRPAQLDERREVPYA